MQCAVLSLLCGEQLVSCNNCNWSYWNLCDYGRWIQGPIPWMHLTTLAKHGSSNPTQVMFYLVFVLLWFVVILMNGIGIAWDVVECEVNHTIWYECNQGEFCFFGDMVLLIICSLRDHALLVNYFLNYLVLLVIVRPTLPPRLTLNVNLKPLSITIMSKEGKLKRNNLLEL